MTRLSPDECGSLSYVTKLMWLNFPRGVSLQKSRTHFQKILKIPQICLRS
jgi:hypothetical protein